MANSIKENKAAIIRLWNVVDQQRAKGNVDQEAFKDLIAEDYIDHQDLGQGDGYDGWIKRVEWIIQAFPDFNIDMKMVIAEENLVVCQYENTGTFESKFPGMKPMKKHYKVESAHVFRLYDGKIAEHWPYQPGFELFAEIGIIDEVVADLKQQLAA